MTQRKRAGSAQPTPDSSGHAAESVTQELVARVWRTVLGREDFGLDDQWEALGGDWSAAIRAVPLLARHGWAVTPAQLLAAGTVRVLAAQLLVPRPADEPPPLTRRPGGTPVVTTPMQRWLWQRKFADPARVSQARLFAVPAETTTEQLRALLNRVLGRHEAFRTVFVDSPEGRTGLLLDELPAVEVLEYAVNPPAHGDPIEHPDPVRLAHLHEGLDLESGPLWQAGVYIDYVTRRRWLYLVVHWLLIDAVSWEVLIGELTIEFTQPESLPPIAPALTSPAPETCPQDETYWDFLAEQDLPVLVCDRDRTGRAPHAELVHSAVTLSPHVTHALHEIAQRAPVSLEDIVLAAVCEALKPLTTGEGLYAWLNSHGRGHLDDGDIIGALAGYSPALLTATAAPDEPDASATGHAPASLLRVAQRFHRQLAQIPREGTAFTSYAQPGGVLAHTAMPAVTIDYLDSVPAIDGPLRVVPVATQQYYGPTNRSATPVNITSVITDATLRIDVAVDPGLLSPDLQSSICGTVRGVLERLAYLQPLTAQPIPGARQVFFVHPDIAETRWYRDVADALGPAVDCHALGAETAPCALDQDDLVALADRYVERIRVIQPSGPYRLAGSDTGAVIAFAMAQQLQEANQTVERLVLIAPPPRDRLGPGLIVPAALTAHLIPLLPDTAPRRVYDAVNEALAAPREQRLKLLVDRLADGDPNLADEVGILLGLHDLMARWQPQGAIDSLHIVHPDDPGGRDTADGWKGVGRCSQTVPVPGDRRTLLSNQDALRTIADILTGATPPPSYDGAARA